MIDDEARRRSAVPWRWTIGIGCCVAVVLGVAVSANTYVSMMTHGHTYWRILGWQVASWCFWGLSSPLLLQVGTGFRGSVRDHGGTGLRAVLLAVTLIVLHFCVVAQLTVWFEPFRPIETLPFRPGLYQAYRAYVVTDVMICGLLLVGGSALGWQHRARQLERRESRLEVELARAQLEALRLEIHPHFLFNTLNSIAALIRLKDNGGALKMLLDLSELMRATVDAPKEPLVALATELDFLGRYIDLQKTRFADRLIVEYQISDECLAVPVPSFLLQPLVENAMRHGAAHHARPCRVQIGARVEAGRMRVWVGDDGEGLPQGFEIDRDAGTGLRNTRSRLTQLYDGAAAFIIHGNAIHGNAAAPGTLVEMRLPLTPPVRHVRATA